MVAASVLAGIVLFTGGCTGAGSANAALERNEIMNNNRGSLRIGWAQADITPEGPCFVAGQFHARISEEVLDPVTANVLVLETDDDAAIFVSCDVVVIPDELRDSVRNLLADVDGLDVSKLMINATHSHTGPELRIRPNDGELMAGVFGGVELDALDAGVVQPFVARRIAQAVRQAWTSRKPGKLAYGQGAAVIGHNRRWVDVNGRATMYGNTNTPDFSHIEGYEDHTLGLVATYDDRGHLTGLVVNVPCPSQVSEHQFAVSADFWHETREELRSRYGRNLHVLGQVSAAGDQSPHLIFDKAAAKRMQELSGRSTRQEIAHRIVNAVSDILPLIEPTASDAVRLTHHVATIDLPLNALTEEDVKTSLEEADKLHDVYRQELKKLQDNPSLRAEPRWYTTATAAYRRMLWYRAVADRYEAQKKSPTTPVEMHVLRLDDLAIATNPFEYYLDFGVYIKTRSPAVQTMLVQLTGGGTYCPSPRSVAGEGYGSLPASNPVGPAGGRMLADETINALLKMWAE